MAQTYLLLYSSTDGQTLKIMQHIAAQLQQQAPDCQVCLHDVQQPLQPQWAEYRAVVIGASIRYGHFSRQVQRWIAQYQSELQQLPTAFFGVNLTARKPEKNTPETNAYVRKFLQRSVWQPTVAAVFAGALYYPRYRWFDRVMIQFIMRMTGGETDPSKEVEYTDWNKVSEFAQKIADLAPSTQA
ncbi:Protoporphyrinogen IX dehydrogenase [menaquinone] [Plesiomonas shigelloides]|uniref:menaquinone-dependent protoporphyrinogen IX dehydrogenase n=1 Tax=Plesiomonas shigelloides TaxID=703 RepID=UPI000E006D67|nr:menaquinone-dependent protoporphyrinogen IX dehydrogenase [Plesiomonas shigelloides]SUB65189.1 Protoporphyrinogen IX dehydrogenase [menaquinone] [Plesiomonas shigelloides]